MRFGRSIRLVVVGAVLAAGATACEPPAPPAPIPPKAEAGASPWYCAPTAFNSVTGLGMGTVNFYAGLRRKDLLPAECASLATNMASAKAYAAQYPTRADAEEAGFTVAFEFFSGMGTHHGREAFTEEVINAPSFNRHDPILPGTSAFDPTKPNFLQYDSDGPDAELVGMSWYIRSANGKPPAGFDGGLDWWHHHPRLCLTKQDPTIVGINTSDQGCAFSNGINLNMEKYFMLHLWVVDDLEFEADVFAPMHPCIQYGDTVFDMDDPCHDVPDEHATGGRTPRNRSTPAAGASTLGYCPLGSGLAER